LSGFRDSDRGGDGRIAGNDLSLLELRVVADSGDIEARPAAKGSLDTWFVGVYEQLRGLARQRLAGERAEHTLQPTALVNEVFLRLQKDGTLVDADHAKFFLAAAEAMRRILIEHARAKGSLKRGGGGGAGGAARRISLDAADWASEQNLDQILTMDEAISRMEQKSPDAAQVVRLRFYAGLGVNETAGVMNVSVATIMRLWRYARAWLWRELKAEI
jgi:RNA polymerase sigma factor (TIGR02999 family)